MKVDRIRLMLLSLSDREFQTIEPAKQWRRQDFVTGEEVRYGSIGGLEYEAPEKLTRLLQCIENL